MPVQGKYLYYGDDLSEAFQIRKEVFQDEQGVSEKEDIDEIDELAIHVVVYSNENSKKPVATGRVFFDGNDYYIGRIAVLKDERGKSYGDFAVRMLANKAFLAGANEILIHSQVSAVPFYEKIGFVTYGDEFIEAGIKHISMKLVAGSLCKKCISMTKE